MTDVTFCDEGSLVRITPLTEAALDWIDANVASEGLQWLGRSLCVDWRHGALILVGLEDAGLEVDGSF
jgi:hypothetical protein